MKTIEEIFRKYCIDYGAIAFVDFENGKKAMKEYAEECVIEALEKASRMAYAEYGAEFCKESITNVKIDYK